MLDYIQTGGWMMYVIGGTAIVLYALLLERLLYYRSMRRDMQRVHAWRQIQHGERIAIIRALIAALPLMGLLGTVGGMMATFSSMRVGSAVGEGVSQSLLTTQYALTLAVPALVFELWIQRALRRVELGERMQELQGASDA